MLFSILVPVYQAEKYLPECLASIEDQTCPDFEVVLVDDGSTDGGGAMCDAFAQKHAGRVQVIHKKNEGLISARRVGIHAAQGQYCIFLDADDMLDAYALQILADKLKAYDYPDMALYRFFNYSRNRITPCDYPVYRSDFLCEGEQKRIFYQGILEGTTINHLGTKAIRSELLRSDPTDYRQYDSKNMAEDLLQTLYPLTYAQNVLYINEHLYYYRENSDGFTHNFDLKTLHQKNSLHVYKLIQQYLPLWGLDIPESYDLLHARWISTTVSEMFRCFSAAHTKTQKLDVLRFSWHEFVDAQRPIPACLNTDTAYAWHLYISQDIAKLYLEWL